MSSAQWEKLGTFLKQKHNSRGQKHVLQIEKHQRVPSKSLFYLLALILLVSPSVNQTVYGQVVTEWEKTMGGSDEDKAKSIVQTRDGGYIVAGHSKSSSGDVNGQKGGFDFWVVKMAMNGQIDWEKSLGGTRNDKANSILECEDGSYIVAGTSFSNDGSAVRDEAGKSGKADFWVIHLSEYGELLWQTRLGGSENERANSVSMGADGSIFVAGSTSSSDGDCAGNRHKGKEDFWLVKLDKTGKLVWQRASGSAGTDVANAVLATADGGCVFLGESDAATNGLYRNNGKNDIVLFKYDASGKKEWSKNYGGMEDDRGYDIKSITGGWYILTGSTASSDTDFSANAGATDAFAMKINSKGDLVWSKTYGGSLSETAYSIDVVPNVGYIIAGSTNSQDGMVKKAKGDKDIWVVKLDESGNAIWEKSLGGTAKDEAFSISQTFDAGYIVAGYTNSSNADVKDTKGFYDYWLIKLKEVPPRITAICYEDLNLNGTYEREEPLKFDQVLLLQPKAFYSFTDDTGNSIFYVEPAKYRLSCVPPEGYKITSEASEFQIEVEEDADIVRYFGLAKEDAKPPVEEVEEEPIVEEAPVVQQKALRKASDIECGKTLELSKLTFKPNSSSFTKEKSAKEYLEVLIDFLKSNDASIELYGHTDFLSKNKEWLHELSEQRVERVKELLVKKGIKEHRIKTKAFGGTLPIVKDKDNPSRGKNRRVEVKIECD